MSAIEFTGRSPPRQGMVDWGGELRFVRYSVSQNVPFIMYTIMVSQHFKIYMVYIHFQSVSVRVGALLLYHTTYTYHTIIICIHILL